MLVKVNCFLVDFPSGATRGGCRVSWHAHDRAGWLASEIHLQHTVLMWAGVLVISRDARFHRQTLCANLMCGGCSCKPAGSGGRPHPRSAVMNLSKSAVGGLLAGFYKLPCYLCRIGRGA